MPKNRTNEKSMLVQVMAITWANVDLDPYSHTTFVGHNELI